MLAAKGGIWLDFEKRTDKWTLCNDKKSHIYIVNKNVTELYLVYCLVTTNYTRCKLGYIKKVTKLTTNII
jgi:hypothetical protein